MHENQRRKTQSSNQSPNQSRIMNEMAPGPHLSRRILEAVRMHGPMTFTQVVHATRANRGSVWRTLQALRRRGDVRTLTQHGRIHYVAVSDGSPMIDD
jgi:hypothetical protein